MNRPLVRWILGIWSPFRAIAALILAVTAASTAVKAALPLVLKQAFDGLAEGEAAETLLSAVLIYLGLGTLEWALTSALVFTRGYMNRRFEWAAAARAYGRLVRQGPAFFQRFRTGDLVTRLTDDVSEKLSWFLCSGIFRTAAALATVLFALVMMIRLDPFLTLFTAGPLPVLVFLFVRTGTLLDERFDAVQVRISRMNAALESVFTGIRVVKAYGREEAEERSFERFASDCRRAEMDAARSQFLVDSLYGQVWQLGVVAVLLAGGVAVMNGRMTLGTFVAFDAWVLMLIFPMLDIGTFLVRGRQAGVSVARLRGIEESVPAVADPDRVAPGAQPSGRLRFESVGYEHPAPPGAPAGAADAAPRTARRAALDGVSFELRPGEMVALAGRIGSGKSVLLRLVPRLVDPTSGRVLLDGADLRELPLDRVRSDVGLVPQDPVLFSGTIRENIRFDRPGIGEEEILRAVRTARLEKDLRSFGEGLDTRVGARGITLSGGQKQRVALARALAGSPRILVLDDATSALDAETEAALWEELHRTVPELAKLVVTHRTATLERADRILVLEEGRLVETGTHADLSARGAVYRSLYRRQRLEERVGGPADEPGAPSPGPA